MTRLHLWIVLLALMAGLVGFAVGRLSAPVERPSPVGAFPGYCERMEATFDLSPDRVRAMRLLLERYNRDLEDLKNRHLDELRPELARLGDTYRDWIRDKVLPMERRSDFDRLVTGATVSLTD